MYFGASLILIQTDYSLLIMFFFLTCFSGYVVWYARDLRQNRIRTLIGCFHRRVDDRDLKIAIQVFLYDIFSSPVILFLKLTGYIKLEVI